MVDVAGTDLSPEDIEVLSHPLVGSVLLFSRNYRNPKQIAELCEPFARSARRTCLIADDHEGGRSSAFAKDLPSCPPRACSAAVLTRTAREGLRSRTSVGWLMAAKLRAVGVDFSFAPCVDLD